MHDGLAAEKRRVRRSLSQLRRCVAPGEAALVARRIAERLLAEPAVQRARRIALYAALPDEVPSRPLFDALRGLRESLLFPRVQDARALVFASVSDWSALRPGRYGVLEPPDSAAAIEPGEGDLVLVPGVAFDRAGNRLGRGQGYYDRAFPRTAARPPLLMGVAYAIQLLDAVPHAAADRRMDAVLTEHALLWTGSTAP
jgi:5-formyltetrahydrofolate cyclo-ligase